MKLANNRFGNQLEDRAVSWVQQRDKPGERKPPMMILVRKQKLLQQSSALCRILQKTVWGRKNKGDKGGDASSWWESLERSVCMTGRAKGGCFSVWRCCAAPADLQGEAVIVFFYLHLSYSASLLLLFNSADVSTLFEYFHTLKYKVNKKIRILLLSYFLMLASSAKISHSKQANVSLAGKIWLDYWLVISNVL